VLWHAGSAEEEAPYLGALQAGLKELGHVEGRTIILENRFAAEQYEKRNQRVRRSFLGPRGQARHLDHPDRDIAFRRYHRPSRELQPTGRQRNRFAVETDLMDAKRLGLLRDLAPGVLLFGALVNPNYPAALRQLQQLEEAAGAINQRLFIAKASTDPELDAAFALLKREGAGALLVAADPYFDTRRDRIVGFAAQQRLPAIYHFREYAVAGGLLSYSVSITEAYRQCGVYTAKILKGANPAELPVLQSTKFELVINLKTAKGLGVKISDDLLSLADEVIE